MDAQQAFPPVIGYPPAIRELVVIINDRQYAPLPDQPRQAESAPLKSCVGWVALAAIVSFVLFLWAAPGDASVWGCPAGCHRDPWASTGTADAMLPGNATLFADPAWQTQQASELLASWGIATGKRSFVALAGAPSTLACTSAIASPYLRDARVHVREDYGPRLPDQHSQAVISPECWRCCVHGAAAMACRDVCRRRRDP